MRNKTGFTLIELLAVIVILAIIALISTPLIVGIIENARKNTYKESLREIFNATELYIATNEFIAFPESGINITDSRIKMKNKDFTSGKIIKNEQGTFELVKVSNGVFCGSGTYDNIIIIEGSCDSLDITPPTISIASNSVTSNSITIVASAEDLESGINGYQFSSDNGINWTTKQVSNVYNFLELTSNTDYTFKVKVFNNNNLSATSESLIVTTSQNLAPTYSVDITGWSQSKVVTITYPERQAGYIYEYSTNEGTTWEEVASPATTKDLTFTDNGSIVARVLDGVSELSSSSYNVTNIDIDSPTVTYSMNGNNIYAKDRGTTVNVSDAGAGIVVDSLKYLWNTSTTDPSESEFLNGFTNGEIITVPAGLTGDYYLWILAKDNAGNIIITRTNAFKLDNTKPIITLIGSNPLTITQGATYNEFGATANDNADGNITSDIIISGAVNTNVIGSYTITYNVTDSAGNIATPVNRNVNVIMPVNQVAAMGIFLEDPIWQVRRAYKINSDKTVTMYQTSYGVSGAVDGYKDLALTGITSVAAQSSTVYGVKENGTVVSQSCNYTSSSCTGTGSAMSGFQNVISVAAMAELYENPTWQARRVYGLKNDGTVTMYQSTYGVSGAVDGYKELPLTEITAIAAESSTVYAVKSNGTVTQYSCRFDASTCTGTGSIMSGFSDVKLVAATSVKLENPTWQTRRVYGLKNDGTVTMYQSTYGVSGAVDGYKELPLTGITAISAESNNIYATKTDGTVIKYTCDYDAAVCTGTGSIMSGFSE